MQIVNAMNASFKSEEICPFGKTSSIGGWERINRWMGAFTTEDAEGREFAAGPALRIETRARSK
jgi:hypothetical protein